MWPSRALHDGKQVAFLLEYADPTQDPDDGAALEFMVGDKKAHFAHGQPMLQVEGGPVNIWFWKNKTGKAVGHECQRFRHIEAASASRRERKGRLLKRDLENGLFQQSLDRPCRRKMFKLRREQFISIAFAVWDGRKDGAGELVEKGSQKAVSSWWYFRADAPPDYSSYMYAAVAAALALGFQFVLIRKLKKGQ